MNKSFRITFLFVFICSFLTSLYAQQELSKILLPVDPKVKIGKLENGFTYYIRANQKPEKRVEMRLVVNAGSILENEDQQGLAHFVEHMCFNGTENFEKNELKNYLESIGIRFGPELNAYTSFDETVYMLTIPSDSINLLEKGFLVMEDWAHRVTFSDEEIDKERGVIVEEWRMGQGYRQRMRDKYFPVLFKDSRYAERLPIGKKEVIENCDHETLRSFYRDWYRPDLMALVVVGDIDTAYANKKIVEHFSNLHNPAEERNRELFNVPDQKGTSVSIVTDAEAPVSMVYTIYKTDAEKENTYEDYLRDLQYSFLTGMLNRRLVEISEKENPPFIGANYAYGGLGARTKYALQGYALVGETGIDKGLESILLEAEKLYRFGFTQGEFERFRLDLLNQYENAYKERDKTESRQWAGEYVRNFLEDEPIPGIEFEYEFVKKYNQQISLEDINKLAKRLISNDNRVIVIGAPDKPSVITPKEEDIYKLTDSISKRQIAPYEDKTVATSLLTKLPNPGKIVRKIALDSIQAVELKLSNGARVILKSTDFKNDEIVFSAFSMGGHSVYNDSDYFTAMNADGIIQESGVADFSNSDLSKILAGKNIYVAPVISTELEQINAQSKKADLESMFQLMYLYFTNPRTDRSAFNSYITKKKELFENLAKDPQNYFYDQYYRFKAQNHPRGDYLPQPEDWDKIHFERSIEIYKERFADAQNFTFIMVGAFNIDSVKPLIERYIGGLPTRKREENYVDLGIRPPKIKEIHDVFKGTDPKSLAIVYFEKEMPWNERDAFMISSLSDILGFNYIDKLREEMSGVYTVRVKASMQKIPYSCADLQIVIPCAPENVDSLIHAAVGVLADIQLNGVNPSDIIKAKETRRRQLETNLKTNKYWLNTIQNALINGKALVQITLEEYINQISSEEIQRVAREYFDVSNYLQVVLFPEGYKKNK
jgi:zinc protease